MLIPWKKGRITPQAHVGLPEGTSEEEYARSGFSGAYAHLYRPEPLVGWSRIEGPLKPRAFNLAERLGGPNAGIDYLASRKAVLANDDVMIGFVRVETAMPYYFRNADADEVLFVHAGGGRLETDFGPIDYRRGDYLMIPRGTMYRLEPSDTTALLIVATAGETSFPERGLLGQHALFDPAVIEVPEPAPNGVNSTLAGTPRGDIQEWEVRIQRGGEMTSVFYPFCPLNAVGWKGTLSVQRLNVADIRPVMSERYHLPPSAHATCIADGVIICTFLPRQLENGDAKALKVPFYHNNIDFDEVLFYHDGQFFSRTDIQAGMLTYHPQGIHHGPQPGAAERAADATATNEIAVMIDTRRPLKVCDDALGAELPDYWKSWGGVK